MSSPQTIPRRKAETSHEQDSTGSAAASKGSKVCGEARKERGGPAGPGLGEEAEAARRDGKHLYQWTAIDKCTRLRFVYGYEEHTPGNSVDFLGRLLKAFPFPIQTVQTDNGTEFTYRFISDKELCPFEVTLAARGLAHKPIPPRTPCHNGKVERSHRSDQRYFYDGEKFSNVQELNRKLRAHLS